MLAAAALAGLLTACGGGGGGGDSEAWGLQYLSFNAGAGTLDPSASATATSFTMSWQAQRTGGNPGYYVRAYLVPANTANPVLDDSTAFMGANCGPNVTGCDTSGAVSCSYVAGTNDPAKRRIDCGTTHGLARGLERATGSYVVIGRACYYATNLETVCSDQPGQNLLLR